MITVSLLDDHPVVLDGIQRMLRDAKDIKLLPFFHEAEALTTYLTGCVPDVLLLDLIFPGIHPRNLPLSFRENYPAMKILVMTSLDQPYLAFSLIEAGINGYLLKSCDKYMLLEAIRVVHAGAKYLDPALQKQFTGMQHALPHAGIHLSEREIRMLQLIAEEYTNAGIARQLHLGLKSIEAIRKDLYLKLGVTNGAGAVRKAIELGLLGWRSWFYQG